MNIIGIDMSINSPAVVYFELDDDLEVTKKEYLTFSKTKKNLTNDILLCRNNDFDNEYDKYMYVRDNIKEFLQDKKIDYAALEGYSYNSSGKVFNIAEITCLVKIYLYEERRIPFRIYEPTSIKMFFALDGRADKISMEKVYDKIDVNDRFDLSFLPKVYETDSNGGNPADNIIDAYFIAKLLQVELKLRHGLLRVKDLKELKRIQVFNKVSDKKGGNLLDVDFIERKLV